MSLENLLELHKSVARSAGCMVDGEGRLFAADGETPLCAEKKQYILPTQAFLQRGGDDYLPFYLLGEDISSAESQVLQKTRSLMVYELTSQIVMLVGYFLQLGADHKQHVKLNVRQKAVLKHVAKADEESFRIWEKIALALSNKGQKMLVKFYQKFQGKIGADSYSRICSVSLPILDELEVATENKNKVFGVTCRVMDIEMFTNVLYYILGESAAEDGFFSRGSNDLTAPYFVSLSQSFIAIANVLNVKLKLFGLDVIDTSWEEELTNLASYRGLIPSGLPGTVGATEVTRVNSKRPVIGLQQEAYSGGVNVQTTREEPVQVIESNRPVAEQPKNGYGTYQPKQYVQPEPQIVQQPTVYQHTNQVIQPPTKPTGNKMSWEDVKRLKGSQVQQNNQQIVYTNSNVQTAAPQMVQVGVDQHGRPVFQPVQNQAATQVIYTQTQSHQQHNPAGSQLAINTDPNAYFHQPANNNQTHGGTYYASNGGYVAPNNNQIYYAN